MCSLGFVHFSLPSLGLRHVCFFLHDVRLRKCRNKFMRSKNIVQPLWGAFKKFNRSWRADFLLAFLANSCAPEKTLPSAEVLPRKNSGICVDGYGNHHKVYNTPRKITWNQNMEVWKMIFLLNWIIFRFHVNFPGCNWDSFLGIQWTA